METYSEALKKRNKKKKKEEKKKRKALPIILIVLGAILLLILATALFFYIKMRRMGRNAPPFVPTAIVLPETTAAPAELVDVEDPGYITIQDDDPNTPMTPEELDILNDLIDPENDPYDPDNIPIDPNDPGAIDWGNDPIHYVPRINGNVINILLLGNDAFAGDRDHGRSDVMVLLSYNKAKRSAKLVSFVRDAYIYIPGRNKWNRINTAFRFGGVGLAINTINVNFGLDIQHYVRVDFTTMRRLVDTVGGIDVELSVKEVQYINKGASPDLPLVAGVHHLNGKQAVRHARNRSVGNHVWTRSERHIQILEAILERAKQERNPVALMALMYQLVDKLDTNLPVEEMVSLGVDVVFGGALKTSSNVLPFKGTWQYAIERGMYVIKFDIPANRQKLHEFLYGN